MRVIKGRQVVEDGWRRVPDLKPEDGLPPGQVIVPFAWWQVHREQLTASSGQYAVCIDGAHEITEVARDLSRFVLIALEFPAFKDGRCYSHARLLRERYGYQGELRAVGDVLRDQLYFMERCGIDSYEVRADKDIEDALSAFKEFSVTYQTAADGAVPVYKRR